VLDDAVGQEGHQPMQKKGEGIPMQVVLGSSTCLVAVAWKRLRGHGNEGEGWHNGGEAVSLEQGDGACRACRGRGEACGGQVQVCMGTGVGMSVGVGFVGVVVELGCEEGQGRV